VLGGGAPIYKRDSAVPKYLEKVNAFDIAKIEQPTDFIATAKKVFASPNIVSKRWVYEQYDSMVRTNSMSTNQPSDAALVRVKGTEKALAVTTDCNSAYVYADPYIGAMIAVAEAARNITCSGGVPVAITNCLNFGNPYNPEVYYQFENAIKGMGDACRKFNTPVTGGNVSFYNQSVIDKVVEPVYPTPTIGMLGILDDHKNQMTLGFKAEGDLIFLLGEAHDDINSSEYLRVVHDVHHSPNPHFDLNVEFDLQQKIQKLITEKLVVSCHDISDGGLFVNLVESAMVENHGFEVNTDLNIRKDAYLFGEGQSRVVVTVKPWNEMTFLHFLEKHNIPHTQLGKVFGSKINIDGEDYGNVAEWKHTFDTTLENKLENS